MVENSVTEQGAGHNSGHTDKRKGTILIIDQDDNTCEFLSSVIKLIGCEYMLVKTVEQGMELLEKNTFDLLITDLHLPNSHEFLQTSMEKHPQMQTIVMVQHRQIFFEAMRLPSATFIQKPFNFDDIVQKIHQAIHHGNIKQVENQIQRLRHEIFRL
jgi:DNA-binding NtrC family response regulator